MSGQLAASRAARPRLGATPSGLSHCGPQIRSGGFLSGGSVASWTGGSKSPLFSVSRIASVPDSTTSEHYILATSEMVGDGDSELADPKKLAVQHKDPCPRQRHFLRRPLPPPPHTTTYRFPHLSRFLAPHLQDAREHSRSGRIAYPTKSPASRQQLARERRRRVELTQNWVWFRGDYLRVNLPVRVLLLASRQALLRAAMSCPSGLFLASANTFFFFSLGA
jgi:hypothetical protein